jgi:CubicO group peptidase (beta-lactamase class C family)
MYLRLFSVLAILVLAFTIIQPLPSQAAGGDDFAAALDERMPDLLVKYRVPGAVVSYIRNGEVAWTRSYGLADKSSQKHMSAEMIFNFGSTGKVLTGWGVMRLVEQGKVDLDAPVNQYLKRWQIQSMDYDAQKVTLRRLLSHTAGLTVSGFSDYSQRLRLPTLAEMLAGQNQTDGKVVLFQEPGKGVQYSGGGFVLLQMVIEDVSGEPFAQFMGREVTGPLGMPTLHWTWTPELSALAPVPYGPQGEALSYRQLASQAIGSEIDTVPDYARFVAAAVSGPNGEPPGRGVLRPETIAAMTAIQPIAVNEGLAYGVTTVPNGVMLQHFGNNPGWSAFFSVDTNLREGLVMAANSSNGFPLCATVQNLWAKTIYNQSGPLVERAPDPSNLPTQAVIELALAGLLGLGLLVSLALFLRGLLLKKRARVNRPNAKGLVWAGIWALLALYWIYWFYTTLPLPFPPSFPDFWHTPQVDLVLSVLLAWVVLSLARAWVPSKNAA